MTSQPRDVAPACRIARLADTRVLEVARFGGATAPAGWPSAPGEVSRNTAGFPAMLHFAPGRWLVPVNTFDLDAALAAARACSAVVDVTGKWQAFAITGAARLLASTVAMEAVLDGRECAAATLFDCPAIVARTADGYLVWVQSSYAADFLSTASRIGGTI